MRRFVIVMGSCLALLLAGVAGCGDDDEKDGGDKITIGLLAPFSGSLAGFGAAMKNAANMAVAEINAAGGLGDGKYQLAVNPLDDGTDADVSKTAARTLVDKGVVGIVGPATSGSALAVATEIGPDGIVMISPSATSPALTATTGDPNGIFYRTAASDAKQGIAAADYAFNKLGAKTAGVLFLNNAYGKGLKDAFKDRFVELTGQVINEVQYDEMDAATLDKYDFASDITALFANGPDLVFLITYFDDGAKATLEMKKQMPATPPKIMGCDGNYGSDFLDKADPGVVAGMVGTAPTVSKSDPEYVTYSGAYKNKFGEDAEQFSESAYDAFYLMAYALEAWIKQNPEKGKPTKAALPGPLVDLSGEPGDKVGVAKWKEGVAKLGADGTGDFDYQGASGPIDWDSVGDTQGGYYLIWEVKDGKFQEVETVPVTE